MRDEILNMKPGRELDALVAEKVMGLKDERPKYDQCMVYKAKSDDELKILQVFSPSTDISAAWEVEAIFDQDSDIRAKYAIQLHTVLGLWLHEPTTLNNVFQFAHATPEQRCKAALLAVLEDKS